VIRWLWSALLSDGTRALTRAGRWAQALQHAQQHKGIGQRLLDDIVRASGLGRGKVPADMLDDLMESVRASEAWIADALAAQTP
ncbi:MAG: hypothetical protein ACRDTE_02600, partial [Pseudonocardiaceae bacterium]